MFGFSCYFQVQCCRMAWLTETPAGLDVELQTLLQHTEVRWLAIRRVLRPWDAICDFVKDLEKDEKKKIRPRALSSRECPATQLATTSERDAMIFLLEFFCNVSSCLKNF